MIAQSTLAATMLIALGIPGLYLNLLTTLSFLGASTPFEIVCACHAAGNVGVIAVMVFCSAPMIYFGSPALNDSEFGKMAGRITMYSWFLIHYTQVILDGCHFVFLLKSWQWSFEPTQCGMVLGIYLNFYFTVALLVCCTLFDVCTAMSIYRHLMITRSGERPFSTTDILFFVQSCLSNFVFIVDLALFFVGPKIYQDMFNKLPDTFGGFLINTFTIQISHFLDGLIMVMFNRKTRAHIFSPRTLVHVRAKGSQGRVSDVSRTRREQQRHENNTGRTDDVRLEQSEDRNHRNAGQGTAEGNNVKP
ncbi:hypothetical protein ANCCEY_09713 [Ancylostoma ceylanicum]|uniref:7TM GPCR serpentine receptor class x (Srx) domain-containing protein n=1 Tax=Ancylostoma ceylanicum TaxID=53326 RepID=A0A0D6LGR6_9BILA|nr:hypothetical protein ANCCEY_09713 [Ancylostoma ceylanicum]